MFLFIIFLGWYWWSRTSSPSLSYSSGNRKILSGSRWLLRLFWRSRGNRKNWNWYPRWKMLMVNRAGSSKSESKTKRRTKGKIFSYLIALWILNQNIATYCLSYKYQTFSSFQFTEALRKSWTRKNCKNNGSLWRIEDTKTIPSIRGGSIQWYT